ncbi:hypothetical protein T4B_8388 [Trichinella pseudospiralis]|uniref:Uncharacterized protein n=1 Tax=Trichinella pseudospiralis TaxID=6337 RepID=A0A0V1E072_TRIPS|nr:hypothetical protein T4A_6704 [Trichinella pseudospiralis]KRZ22603.1 hypothetical protein T4B_8388 [Trichinella pseudospiralis]
MFGCIYGRALSLSINKVHLIRVTIHGGTDFSQQSAYCSNSKLLSATRLAKTAMRFRSPTVIDEHLENGPE